MGSELQEIFRLF